MVFHQLCQPGPKEDLFCAVRKSGRFEDLLFELPQPGRMAECVEEAIAVLVACALEWELFLRFFGLPAKPAAASGASLLHITRRNALY